MAVRKHNYGFKVYFHKTDKVKTKTEIETLTAEKRKLESDICEKDTKISKLTNTGENHLKMWLKNYESVDIITKGV